MHRRAQMIIAGALVLGSAGCGQPEAESGTPRAPSAAHPTRQLSQPIRPTSDDPYLGLGYGEVEADHLDSPGGAVRVWWALEGRHVPPLEDVDPADGIPDHPELVAGVADEVTARLEQDGARLARPDDEIATTLDDGGGGRFDIYLVDFGGGSDGLVRKNACGPDGTSAVPTCTAHMLIENDFAGYGYPSIEEAVSVLVAHEYFHAVQAAYVDELPAWYSEGTATWFQEHFDPTQSDFERLADRYFQAAGRSLLAPTQGPFDGFHYSCALLFYHLDLTLGPEVVFGSLDRLSEGEGVVEALDGAIQAAGPTDLAGAYERFVAWNYFTGPRAREGAGYPRSSLWSQVPVRELDATRGLNWDLELDALSARYAQLRVEAPTRVELRPIEGAPIQPRLLVLEGPDDVVSLGPGEPVELEAREVLEVAVVHPGTGGEAAGRVAVRLRQADPEPIPDMGPGMGEPDMGAPAPPDMDATALEPDMEGGAQEPDMGPSSPVILERSEDDDGGDEGGCAQASSPAPVVPVGWGLLGMAWVGLRRARRRR